MAARIAIIATTTNSSINVKPRVRGDRPTTIYLCLPVGRMESHYRWLRLIVQMACTVLEHLGPYPRNRPPILFMMEEFATLGHLQIMERAAAYFPGFGIKLWAVLQDTTQLQRYYQSSWETFLGNAGLLHCFSNGDQSTLEYISKRLEKLIQPSELRTAFGRRQFTQLLMMEGEPSPLLRFADRLRPDAAAAVERLKAMGVEPMILSGDRRATVLTVAPAVPSSPPLRTTVIEALPAPSLTL